MPTTPPRPLPHVNQFIQNTVPKRARSHIGLIDHQLGNWKAIEGMHGNIGPKKQMIGDLLILCKTWLSSRSKKNPKKKKVYAVRKPQVEQLGQQAFEWLQFLSFEEAKEQYHQLSRTGGLPRSHFRPAVGLRTPYVAERRLYVANQKQETLSVSHLGDQWKRGAFQGHPELQDLLGKQFTVLSDNDMARLHTALIPLGQSRNVWFLPKSERMEHMVVVGNDGKLYAGFNQPLDLTKYYMYAINKYGNMFCVRSGTKSTPERAFHHSSFNAGNVVVCAGCIIPVDGRPTLNNISGHYAPTIQQLHHAVRMLDEDGLALDEWYVGFRQENGRMGICRARDFLQDMAGTVAHPLKSII
jgi:hypothetical protein